MEPNVDLEFKELSEIACDNDSGFPALVDPRHPQPTFRQDLDDLEKLFGADQVELQKHDVVRSRMEPSRNAPPESSAQSCEDFFDCEKRSSGRGTIKLFKRYIPETNEIAIEAFDHRGECTSTRFVSVDETDEGSLLAKSAIVSEMNKTLSQVRSSMSAADVALAEKAIRSLDLPVFLALIRGAQAPA
jgi:hypothetical protein